MQAAGTAGARVGGPVAMHVLVSGVAASRWGLWTFDLAVSQLLQERVPDSELSAITALLHTSSSERASFFPVFCVFPPRHTADVPIVTSPAMQVPFAGSAYGVCGPRCCVILGHL